MRIIIRKQTWSIVSQVQDGESGFCDHEGERGQPMTIGIKSGLGELEELDTTIHEALHAAYPDLSEDAIGETATDLARLLLARGFGRVS